MAQFNKQQAAAVNPYLLCSAGAGSGKTTVMVASVAHKLMTDPDKSISTFLIITFTNEAAANMRRKIRDKFAEDREKGLEYAKRGLADLENASISTIHAFCKGLISSYFYAVEGMSPKFEIIEEARLEQIFREAYEEALDSIFAEDSTFPSEERELVREVMDSFTQAELVTMCRALYKSLMGIPDPFEHLDGYIDSITLPGEENPWVQEIMFAVDMDLQGLEDFIRQEEDMLCDITPQKCADAAQADRDAVYALLDRLAEGMTAEEMIDALHAANEGMPTVRGKIEDEAKEWNEEFKALRNTVKGSKGVLMTSAKRLENLVKAGQLADNERIQRTLRGISVILRTAAANFRRMKLDMQGIDYSDMEQMAYELIKREDIRRAVREDITDIYVDECQDVSAIQYAIIDALSGGEGRTVCRVGDIKQSIYGFRSAAPDLMERDIQSYSDDEDAQRRKIFFSENYRSCEQVIACVNEVFDTSMDRRISEIDYTPEDHLHANVSGEFGPVRVELITREEGYDVLESQCEAAGRIIRELVEQGRRYGDIVILVRNARSDAEMMVEYFRRQHIPVLYDGAANFYGLTEISSFLSLLTVIDNDHTDTEIIGALKNVPFSFTDEELGMIRQAKQDRSWYYEAFRFCCDRGETPLDLKCSAARDRIMRWRESARTMKISDFIWTLMRESGIYAVRGAYPDGKLRQRNLDSFYGRAVSMEDRGIIRLSDFLGEIDKMRSSPTGDTGDTPAALGDEDNFVRLMTMHKSKGLEFPVVILMNLQRDMRKKPSKSKMRINVGTTEGTNRPLGVYVPLISRKRHIRRDTFGKEAFAVREIRTAIAEDTRLLYVAMTRAQENLILMGSVKESDFPRWNEENKLSRIWKTHSMLDLVMPAVLKSVALPDTGCTASGGDWQLTLDAPRKIESDEHPTPVSVLDMYINAAISRKSEMPSVMWEGGETDRSPLKTSVTSLLRDMERSLPEEEETVEIKRRSEVQGFLLSEVPSRPAFMEEEKASAADRGSVTHRFLRLIDLSRFRWGKGYRRAVEDELQRMRERGILTEAEAKVISVKDVTAFLESELGQKVISADVLHREWPFTMQMEHSPTMVQGIIDAAFMEDGEWVIIDYKTDHDTREEVFVPRHERQMNWYRAAVERLTGVPVREMWLYALRAGRAYRVDRTQI